MVVTNVLKDNESDVLRTVVAAVFVYVADRSS
jgi:hypothetical protein